MTTEHPAEKVAGWKNTPERESEENPVGATMAEQHVLNRKRRIYVGASVIRGCEDERFQGPSRQLFKEFRAGRSTLVTSQEIARALRTAPDAVRAWLRGVPEENVETVEASHEAETLADAYLTADALPAERPDDALHVAVASIAGVDAIASWKGGQLEGLERLGAFNEVNERLGYPRVNIYDPRALCDWDPPPKKGFDAVRWVREVRNQIHEETKDMSSEEFILWLKSRRPKHPALAAAWDRAKPPVGRRAPTPRTDQ